MAKSTILGPDGQPIERHALHAPQTAHYGHLQRELQTHPTRGLTPTKLAAILDQAENGDVIAQFDLFEDMEEKDGHIAAELGKRRRAALVDWSIDPPDNPSAAEQKAAAELTELVAEIADFEDVLFDVTDAIGKGFACLEIEWHKVGPYHVPRHITHRPQSWFTLHRGQRQELRLRTGSTDADGIVGERLWPFGWITHVHRAKSGYLERTAMFRALVWPYLFKNYSVGDLAEFLEIYGIPVRIGKYPHGASDKEKTTLLRALVGIGHNAAGIIPEGMQLEFMDAARGDPEAFRLMIEWCERTQSKVILGATLTSGADGKSSTNALGNVHNEVRKDLRDSDIRQLGSTLTRDLLYPLAALNGLAQGGMRRAPVFAFKTREREDLTAYADALPKLVAIGMQIPVQWAQEELGIPQPEEGQPVLQAPATPAANGPAHFAAHTRVLPAAGADVPNRPQNPAQAFYKTLPAAALSAQPAAFAENPQPDPLQEAIDEAAQDWQPAMRPMLQPLLDALERARTQGQSAQEFLAALPGLLASMDASALQRTLDALTFAARAAGVAGLRGDAVDEGRA
ncbi:hypothetical protein CK623_02900 [Vandammella animalimorsus]|uniref:DUF935 domain-containing protein n=1 Tax=Vandammella animalimorsus TaxID=2029117 RepID=A0A2A2ARI2_9BURK|nr:DUF935 domain-containing protein [Vandammella animalimorsus]PAT41205.1 hypothetical protein CK623_02900 [Vandammella animalimorsus]